MTIQDKYPEPELPPSRDPGDYYRNKALAATHWREVLRKAKDVDAPREEIEYIESRLELASNVGD